MLHSVLAKLVDGSKDPVNTGLRIRSQVFVYHLLESLVDQNLIQATAVDGETRFTMLETVREYGADATRFGLIAQSSGQQVRLDMERVENGRNFCNKIWNAARFVLMSWHGMGEAPPCEASRSRERVALDGASLEALAREGSAADRWIASRLAATARDVTAAYDNYRLDEAVRLAYDFFWGEFCDWYLEMSKPTLRAGGEAAERTRRLLVAVLANSLKLLHPIMPFVTEEVWQALPVEGEPALRSPAKPGEAGSIMIAPWPGDLTFRDPDAEETVALPTAVVRVARDLKASHDIEPSRKVPLLVFSPSEEARSILEAMEPVVLLMSGTESLKTFDGRFTPSPDTFARDIFWRGCEVTVCISAPLGEQDRVDLIQRVERDLAKLDSELSRLQSKLDNPNFVEKAPAAVVEKTRAEHAELTRQAQALRARVASLQGR